MGFVDSSDDPSPDERTRTGSDDTLPIDPAPPVPAPPPPLRVVPALASRSTSPPCARLRPHAIRGLRRRGDRRSGRRPAGPGRARGRAHRAWRPPRRHPRRRPAPRRPRAANRSSLSIPVVSHPAGLDFRDDDVVLLAMKSQHTGKALSALLAARAPSASRSCACRTAWPTSRAALRLFEDVYGVCVVLPGAPPRAGRGRGAAPRRSPASSTSAGSRTASTSSRREDRGRVRDAPTFESVPRDRHHAVEVRQAPQQPRQRHRRAVRPRPRGRSVVAPACVDEGATVLAAAGIDVGRRRRRTPPAAASASSGAATPATSRPGASSWQSLARGTGSIEADYLNGEIVLLGRLHGVPTPVNLLLQQLAAAAAREGRSTRARCPSTKLIRMLPPTNDPLTSARRCGPGTEEAVMDSGRRR